MSHLDDIADRIASVSPEWEQQVAVDSSLAARIAGDIHDDRIALGVETIREGHLLHYGTPRVVSAGGAATRVLIGDHCYASGLCDVAASGDLDAVRTLAQLVADVAACDPAEPATPDSQAASWSSAITSLQGARS